MRSFSKIDKLKRVVVRSVKSLQMKTHSFSNLSSQHVRLEINAIARVEIESQAFFLSQGPITMLIKDCSEVIIEMNVIPWIEQLTINSVAKLQLKEDAPMPFRKPSDMNYEYPTSAVSSMSFSC